MGKPRRRKLFLINRNFQIRYSFYVVSWIFALSTVYPLIIHNIFTLFIDHLTLQHGSSGALPMIKDLRRDFIVLILLLHVVFGAVIFLISIFMSHKIAGPLYKLKTYMDAAAAGDARSDLSFRKSDHFQDLAESYNLAVEAIQTGKPTRKASEQTE